MVSAMFSFVLYMYACIIIAQVSSDTVLCPGGTAECPRDNTCCLLSWGEYGCCPSLDATCCSDHTHCCPHGYTCKINAGICKAGTKLLAYLTKTLAKPVNDTKCKNSSQCPDGRSIHQLRSDLDICLNNGAFPCPGGSACCPYGTTCCKEQTGEYGCCPYEDAICCSDGIHCCPEHYTCDMETMQCVRGKDTRSVTKKLPPMSINGTITCQDSTVCPYEATCCDAGSGRYGCCPMKEAVCCADHLHCCPKDYKCDVRPGSCIKGSDVLTWVTMNASRSAPPV